LDDVWDELLPEIEKLQAQGLKIWITGHSLGAALATLAADRLQAVHGLYTFGSPRVGDEAFQARFRPKAYRVVNGKDIVASVPPAGVFRHVGELILIDLKDGRQVPNGTVEESDDASCSGVSNGFERTQEGAKLNSAFLIPSSIRDHVPLLYTIFLWNRLVESLESCVDR
jgi:pimeloyl-ACP methyl ester carboxylesterase